MWKWKKRYISKLTNQNDISDWLSLWLLSPMQNWLSSIYLIFLNPLLLTRPTKLSEMCTSGHFEKVWKCNFYPLWISSHKTKISFDFVLAILWQFDIFWLWVFFGKQISGKYVDRYLYDQNILSSKIIFIVMYDVTLIVVLLNRH